MTVVAHGEWILFGWVLVNQGGLPVPVVPVLIGAGALAAAGRLSLGEALALSVAGTLCADLVWFAAGRWRGARVLGLLGRISPGAPTLVRRTQTGFLAHPRTFRLIARFLPELNPVAAGLAGATGVRPVRFVGWGVLSAIAWAGAWLGLGYLVSDAVTDLAARYGIGLTGFAVSALMIGLVVHRARRHHLLRLLQRARISPGELRARTERGERLVVLDVRSAVEMALDPVRLPGAARIATGDLELRLREVPRDVTVVLYGERSERSSGARAFAYGCLAERLRAAGFRTVRALVGGLHAWRRRGYPLESAVGGGGWPGAPDPTRADDEEIAPGGHPLSLPS
jgi:membrane protein DedA with SNARE-associated domain/rhodanese-related sulfurtransferase